MYNVEKSEATPLPLAIRSEETGGLRRGWRALGQVCALLRGPLGAGDAGGGAILSPRSPAVECRMEGGEN